MIRQWAISLLALVASAARAEEIIIDFESAEIGKPTAEWIEKGVVFQLAGPPTQSKAAGRVMFFPHIATNRKGILNAMATEQAIPVLAALPEPASTVTLVLWGSTGCPARVEALDDSGAVVDSASLAALPTRQAPADPVPFAELTVRAASIAAIRFSGPRNGEFLAVDEIRITPLGR
jgi:hypothetical protein